MKASEFDRTFDAGADVSGQCRLVERKAPERAGKEGECGLPGMGCGRAGPSGAAPWRDPPGAHQVVDR